MYRVRRWMKDERSDRLAFQMDQHLNREDPLDSPGTTTVEEHSNEALLKKIEEQRVQYDLLKGLHTRSMNTRNATNDTLVQTVKQQEIEIDLLKKKLSAAEKAWHSAQTAINDRAALQRTQVEGLQQRLQHFEQLLSLGVHQTDEDSSLRMQLNHLQEMLAVSYRNFDSLRSENSNLKEGMQNVEKEKTDMANEMMEYIDKLNNDLFVVSFKNNITEKKLSDVMTALEEAKKDVSFWTQKYREASRAHRFPEFTPVLQVLPGVQNTNTTFMPYMSGPIPAPFVPPFFMPGMFPPPSMN